MKIKMSRPSLDFKSFEDEIITSIKNVLNHGQFIKGPEVKLLSERLAEKFGRKYVVPCANGTEALQLSLMALDLPEKSEIIIPSFSYIAPAEVVRLLGFSPVFVDVDWDSYCIDPDSIEQCISKNTKAIIPVHLFGLVCDMNPIIKMAQKYHLHIIEDNAQALGSKYLMNEGKWCNSGTFGVFGCTSFFPTKNLACFGDGGAIFLDDQFHYEIIEQLASHGQSKKYIHDQVGLNSRLDTLQAAILLSQLTRFESRIEKKVAIAEIYNERLASCSIVETPKTYKNRSHTYHQYCIKVLQGLRDDLQEFLKLRGIESRIYYPKAGHQQLAYQDSKKANKLINSETLCETVLALPIHYSLSSESINMICDSIIEFETLAT